MPSANGYRDAWTLREGVVYLNHGAFGPSPRVVQVAQQQWQQKLEREPVDFFLRILPVELEASLGKLARFVNAPAEDCVFLDNSTEGMNVVARSVALQSGDEVLVTNHDYGAVQRIWEHTCRDRGARLQICNIPTPIQSSDDWCDAILANVSSRTRLAVFSHVTSPTAMVLPVVQLCEQLRQRGIVTCIDGPHAIAMQPLDIQALDCDFYTASCHKWLCGPFGSGFLYAHPRVQAEIRPAVISWGRPLTDAEYGWQDEFRWQGTRDYAAKLAVATAVEFITEAGLEQFRQQTHAMARYARERIGDVFGLPHLTPDSPRYYGSMVAVPLPPGEAQPLQDILWTDHRIEVPIIEWEAQRLIRVSCHLYTTRDEIDQLVSALQRQLSKT